MKFEEAKMEEYVELGFAVEEDIATDDLEMHFIELPKFRMKSPDVKSKLDQWLWLLVGDERMIEMAKKENGKVKRAAEMLYNMNLTPEEREMYDSRMKAEINYNSMVLSLKEEGMKAGREEGLKQGREEGIEQGIEQGIEEEKNEIARKMKKMKVDIKIIIEVTGLSKEEIEKI